ncbi:MAG: hypothetical protein ACREXX_07500 [Gammaproteobacteria bacterium]
MPNRKTAEVARRLADLGLDPIERMAAIANDSDAPAAVRGRVLAELARYIYPARKSLDATVKLPPGGTLFERTMACLEAVAAGDLSPGQSLTIITAIAAAVRITESTELEARIRALEQSISNVPET